MKFKNRMQILKMNFLLKLRSSMGSSNSICFSYFRGRAHAHLTSLHPKGLPKLIDITTQCKCQHTSWYLRTNSQLYFIYCRNRQDSISPKKRYRNAGFKQQHNRIAWYGTRHLIGYDNMIILLFGTEASIYYVLLLPR